MLAVAVLQAARWALWLVAVTLAGQITAVVGTIWELAVPHSTGHSARVMNVLCGLGR